MLFRSAQFAKKIVDAQRKSFRRYRIWGEWDNPYLALAPEYEVAQIEVFGKMFFQGHIYRGRKPIHWSPSSGTALAEAELEYPKGHISRSVYVVFKVVNVVDTTPNFLKEILPSLGLAIWTTTPWTIPRNATIAINGQLLYVVV